jgi:2-isopropylmalate synthase
MDFSLTTYTEHALEVCSNSKAVAYVGLEKNGKTYWGVGVHSDIINSSISAFLSALNAMLMDLKK